jgi:hypothetical protein
VRPQRARNEEDRMAGQIVVGLYESKGHARDARNRLHTEGVPHSEMAIVVLPEIAEPRRRAPRWRSRCLRREGRG